MRVFTCILSLILLNSCSAKIPARPEQIVQPPVVFTPPTVESWTEDNGLNVLLLEDKDLPLVNGEIYFPVSALTEPGEISGLSDAMFSQLRAGGVKGIPAAEVDRRLDSVGAFIEGAAGKEFSNISFFSHKDDLNAVIGLFSKIVKEPAFDERRLNLWKAQVFDGIDRRRESAEVIAAATFTAAMYGVNSPYSRMPSKATIGKINQATLLSYAKKMIVPNGALLAVSGQISKAELKDLLRINLSDWKKSDAGPRILPDRKALNQSGIYLVESSFPQAAVFVGQEGPARMSVDQYGLSVFNRYFSRGSFGSVLFTEIRSRRGLAYTVDGGFIPERNGGEFIVGMGTRAAEVPNAVGELLRQLELVKQNPPPQDRLGEIKKAVERGFVFNFATPEAAVTREANLQLLGYPKDFNENYLKNISAVSAEEVLDVAKRRIDPTKMVVVIVGKVSAKELSEKLKLPIHPVQFVTEPKFLDRKSVITHENRAQPKIN